MTCPSFINRFKFVIDTEYSDYDMDIEEWMEEYEVDEKYVD